jgi:hypothetical protein
MPRRVPVSLLMIIACAVIWTALDDQSAKPDHTDVQRVAEATGPAEVDREYRPVPSRVDEESIVTGEQSSESCDELSRFTETTGVRVGFAEGVEVDEAACERMLRFSTGAMMPALPGLAGFEVRDIVDSSPSHRLANEADDPSWARGMEGQVLNTIASLIDFPVTTIHAVCRTTTCGLVFAYRSSEHSERNYNFFAQQLADELGFTGYHGGVNMPRSGNWYMTIYLGDWETRRPDSENPARTVPASFEEAFEEFRSAGE